MVVHFIFNMRGRKKSIREVETAMVVLPNGTRSAYGPGTVIRHVSGQQYAEWDDDRVKKHENIRLVIIDPPEPDIKDKKVTPDPVLTEPSKRMEECDASIFGEWDEEGLCSPLAWGGFAQCDSRSHISCTTPQETPGHQVRAVESRQVLGSESHQHVSSQLDEQNDDFLMDYCEFGLRSTP